MKRKLLLDLNMGMFFMAGSLLALSSCTDEDTGGGKEVEQKTGEYFIAVKSSQGSREYVMQAETLEGGDLNISDNVFELPSTEYTWIFRDNLAVGLVYQQQFAGLGYGLRLKADKTLEKVSEFTISNRFTNFGFFENYLLTSVGGQVKADNSRNDGATFTYWDIDQNLAKTNEKTLWTEDITGNGQQVTFSGIIDMGNGEFLTSMVESGFHQTGTGNGSSIGDVAYPDSVWVAAMDKDLNIKRIYRDDRISYSAGQFRSQVWAQIGKADDGTVYVFSNNNVNTHNDVKTNNPSGALRIKPGATEFDKGYMFNLDEHLEGYRFRRVWHMTGNKFFLEIYRDKTASTITPGTQYAIADMEKQTVTWVTGVPDKNKIISGQYSGCIPLFDNGKLYMPITEMGKDATIYMIDPDTGVATEGITIQGVSEIRAIGHLKSE